MTVPATEVGPRLLWVLRPDPDVRLTAGGAWAEAEAAWQDAQREYREATLTWAALDRRLGLAASYLDEAARKWATAREVQRSAETGLSTARACWEGARSIWLAADAAAPEP